MPYSSLFSTLFFSVCVIALVSAILILKNNPMARLNRTYFVMVLAFNFWSIGLGLSNASATQQIGVNWRHFSALGWGLIYALFLHFTLMITLKRELLNTWLKGVIFYIPAILTVFAFALPSPLNPNPYNLVQTNFGWTNIDGFITYNFWDWLFLVYYVTYTAISLILLFMWGLRTNDLSTKKKAFTIFAAFLISFFVGSITDMLLGNIYGNFPQMAPISLIIPILTIYWMIKKHHFIVESKEYNQTNYLLMTIVIVVYSFLAFIQVELSNNTELLHLEFFETLSFRGIITQIQMMVTLVLVLRIDKPGYYAALILNVISLLTSTLYAIRNSSPDPIPAMISYVVVIIVSTLISTYKSNTQMHIKQIDQQKEDIMASERKLYHLAYYDALTGLYSKEWFLQYLQESIQDANTKDEQIVVMFIDLDAFKSINDTMGHTTGDIVLRVVSDRIAQSLSGKKTLARFGGDEFLLMAKYDDDFDAWVQEIMDQFKTPVLIQDLEYFVTASIGTAVHPDDGDTAEMLIKHADLAMYHAKSLGKNQHVHCFKQLKEETTKKAILSNNLNRALDNNELYLCYQPQIDATSQRIVGFEALLRWNDEDYGLVSPDVFIPLAEQTGLIRPIGLWVIETAVRQLKLFQELYKHELKMAVNLSVEQLKDKDIVRKIEDILLKNSVKKGELQVEITESVAFNDDEIIMNRLREIREIGVNIAIDDFGTGFSSLTRLKSFPIDMLKIDLQFVRGISTKSEKDMAIIKSIIEITRNLRIQVLAEGVEEIEQFEFLKHNHCHLIQGFLFYRPLSISEINNILIGKEIQMQYADNQEQLQFNVISSGLFY